MYNREHTTNRREWLLLIERICASKGLVLAKGNWGDK